MVADQIKSALKTLKVPDDLIAKLEEYLTAESSEGGDACEKCPKCGGDMPEPKAVGVSVTEVKKSSPLQDMIAKFKG